MKVTCHICGYKWDYGGHMARATCPSCSYKTNVSKKKMTPSEITRRLLGLD